METNRTLEVDTMVLLQTEPGEGRWPDTRHFIILNKRDIADLEMCGIVGLDKRRVMTDPARIHDLRFGVAHMIMYPETFTQKLGGDFSAYIALLKCLFDFLYSYTLYPDCVIKFA